MDGRPDRGSRPGGTLAGEPLIDTAARLALAGFDPLRYLEDNDLERCHVIAVIVERAEEIAYKRAEDQATMTANAVARMLGAK